MKQQAQRISSGCKHCPWRSTGQPCVWPRGICPRANKGVRR